ncbi:DUF1127 domain-containing protein [Elioraea rosea]|uniref:DUF1127 domain-containing protein n=1 Tax=Elioraea rosea TaxID=2492390 RepID=UPI001182365F|nr:DUF1127 domain-containing protein [Elioraea rosea]
MFATRLADTVAARLALWHERSVGRHVLSLLEPRLLRDIGLDRASAAQEAAKPFWRP